MLFLSFLFHYFHNAILRHDCLQAVNYTLLFAVYTVEN